MGQIEVSLLPLVKEEKIVGVGGWGKEGEMQGGSMQGERREKENMQGENGCRDAGSRRAVAEQDGCIVSC